jgi:hypothetical protein
MIAKYRNPGHPGMWFLTDFTMDQVEKCLKNWEEIIKDLNSKNIANEQRIHDLEEDRKKLKKRLHEKETAEVRAANT